MKRIEIIIPHRKLEAAYEILKNVNAGGMSYYKIEGAGNIKAEPLTVGRGTQQSRPAWHVPRTKVEVVVKDDQVAELIPRITESLGSELGGKIFVVDVPVAHSIPRWFYNINLYYSIILFEAPTTILIVFILVV